MSKRIITSIVLSCVSVFVIVFLVMTDAPLSRGALLAWVLMYLAWLVHPSS